MFSNKGRGNRKHVSWRRGRVQSIFDRWVQATNLADFIIFEGVGVSKDHHMLITNINSNPLFDIIYSDKGDFDILYDLNKKFTHDFGSSISQAIPFEFSTHLHKIGITDYSNKELYLFNQDGTLYKDFPLKGSTMFSISLLNNAGPKFNLITGSSDGFLYNYEVP